MANKKAFDVMDDVRLEESEFDDVEKKPVRKASKDDGEKVELNAVDAADVQAIENSDEFDQSDLDARPVVKSPDDIKTEQEVREVADESITDQHDDIDKSDAPTRAVAEKRNIGEAPEAGEDEVLVKMERQNHVYEVRGIRFTRRSPFAVVERSVAEEIVDSNEGFRIATPSEAEDYYA